MTPVSVPCPLEHGHVPIHLVQATLGHASVATTSTYLHARPTDSSARYLGGPHPVERRVTPGAVAVVSWPRRYAAGRKNEVGDTEAAGGVPFEHVVRFESVDLAQRRFRFYELRWQTTLWGGVAVVRVWGRLGTPDRVRVREYPDRAAAAPDVERALHRRLRRGYRLVAAR